MTTEDAIKTLEETIKKAQATIDEIIDALQSKAILQRMWGGPQQNGTKKSSDDITR